MNDWRKQFRFDPLPPLLSSGNKALLYFVWHDLLGEKIDPVHRLWQLPEAQKILKKQQSDGSWPRTGKKSIRPSAIISSKHGDSSDSWLSSTGSRESIRRHARRPSTFSHAKRKKGTSEAFSPINMRPIIRARSWRFSLKQAMKRIHE